MKSLWPFLKERTALLTTILAAAAVIYGVLLTKRSLRTKAKPGITDAQARIDPGDLPSFRFLKGSFVAVNSGGKHCELMRVRLPHEDFNFEISDITDERTEDIAPHEKDKIGEQLPLSVNRNKTTRVFFFGLHDVETLEELPETLSLELAFDCRKEPLLYNMVRDSDTNKYALYLP
ncbi:MAG: hypothetical protein ACYSYV_10625 [Planctomycetota bacterium]